MYFQTNIMKMSIFIRNYKPGPLATLYKANVWRLNSTTAENSLKKDEDKEEFRVLNILKKRDKQQRRISRRTDIQPDRADRMTENQNWGNVCPGPRTFHPSSVPLPLRQGFVRTAKGQDLRRKLTQK